MDQKQKARLKWAIEGDENTSFFHSIVNHRWRRNKMKGLFCNGSCSSDPATIQNVVFSHFADRFRDLKPIRPSFYCPSLAKLTAEEALALEHPFHADEIRDAVWSGDGSKAPGPDAFNFDFIKRSWPILGNDFTKAIEHFGTTGIIGRGCNASFISLIPKKIDPLEVSDYRPISLLGCYYKAIAKLLANRLVKVMNKLISGNQTTFIPGRQILDRCLVANEIVHFAKTQKKRMFLFKVDF